MQQQSPCTCVVADSRSIYYHWTCGALYREHGAATNGEGGPSLSPAMAGGAEDGRLLLDEATLAELEEEEDEAVLEALLMGVGGGALSQRGGSNGSSSSPTTTLQMLEQRRQQVLKAQKGSAIQEAK